ncbi:DUF4871 domain-containing protein [Paenibacillus dakarensis]|uniref:DUF4871 domain-containing protein n=1 Tax=Paenibacillus dakarensis TaxID=1527293 RepID=UPI0006D544B9|nr:DUF4871 domain-containing protein [Paenibacillus dakarensis]
MNSEQNQNDQAWMEELSSPPFEKNNFTPELMTSVLNRSMNDSQAGKRKKNRMVRAAAAGLSTLAILGAIWIFGAEPFHQNPANPVQQPSAVPGNWAPHSEYMTPEGNPKLHAFPGGEYQAGSPAGSWWNLYVPVSTLEGQSIRITAVHKDTGMQIEELTSTTITPDMAYDDFTRVSSSFALPLSGLWKFDVYIGEEKFGDVVFDVPDSSWEPSPSFRSGVYEMTGVENRLGFIHPPFKANQPNKYMWHFWGSEEELNGDLRITAVKQNSSEIIDVFEGSLRTGKLNNADAALPTTMSLPTPGLWRLMVSIDERLYGSVIVEVE